MHHKLDDPCDPIRHNSDRDVYQSLLERFAKWLKNHQDVKHLFCQHGSYVGFQRSLADMCPLCPEHSCKRKHCRKPHLIRLDLGLPGNV